MELLKKVNKIGPLKSETTTTKKGAQSWWDLRVGAKTIHTVDASAWLCHHSAVSSVFYSNHVCQGTYSNFQAKTTLLSFWLNP